MNRAVITGLGIISSIGNNQKEVLTSLKSGRSGIRFSEEFEKMGLRSHIWGNIQLTENYVKQKIDRKILRFMSDCSIYAYLAMEEAIQDAN
ncbi:MAG: beta-ketoacyl synthase N-terminal-like domain-containing protein, partial [Arsenophonus sp. ET-DL12-MAG3]